MIDFLFYAFIIFYAPFLAVCLIQSLVLFVTQWEYEGFQNLGGVVIAAYGFVPIINILIAGQILMAAILSLAIWVTER